MSKEAARFSPAKKNLIIHIGTHKTGSSALQRLLEKSRRKLAAQKVWYARTNREPHPHLSKHTSLFSSIMRGWDAFQKEKQIIEAEFARSGCETLILSEEALSSFRPNITLFMSSFAENFNITTVCFLRRQDMFLESFWNQRCWEGSAKVNAVQFSKTKICQRRIRYTNMLDEWARFSDVKAIEYDHAKKIGVAEMFTANTGIKLPKKASTANVSPSMNCALVLAHLNKLGKPFDRKRVSKDFREDNTRHALGSIYRAQLLDSVAEQNRVLKEKYGVEFSQAMPDEPPEPLNSPDPDVLAKALRYGGNT